MNLQEIINALSLEVIVGGGNLNQEVTGGYASDLLSDVIAHSQPGQLWITLQIHQNIIGVASLKDLAGIVFVQNRRPEDETRQKAQVANITLLSSPLSTFELVGRLYQLGLQSNS